VAIKNGIGQPVPRKEDPRFLTGHSRYVDDLALPHMTHGVVVRSPHAHAKITSIDTTAAAAAPGLLLVLTGEDYAADGLGGIPCYSIPMPLLTRPPVNGFYPALVKDIARYAGAPVAFVVAETLAQAHDAAELVAVEYEILDAVISAPKAVEPGAAVVWPDAPDNVSFEHTMGNKDAAEAAFAKASHVTSVTIYNNRLTAVSMEPRCCIGEYDFADQRYTLHASCQGPHRVRQALAGPILKVPETAVNVVARDVGGGFGMKGGVYPEDVLAVWAAKKIDRPVKWVADRTEGFMTDTHGRDQTLTAELALDADGKILGLKMDQIYNVGGYLAAGAGVSPAHSATLMSGVYHMPAIFVRTRSVFTNTAPTGPYRGAGRPEATYVLERLLDHAAAETGIDRVEIRRRNFVQPPQMPYKTALNYTYDTGEFETVMDKAIKLSDWDGFAGRRAESEARGCLRGLGISTYLESAGAVNERMGVRFDPSGNVSVLAGTFSHGQGHETIYAQMMAEWLGVPFENVRLIQGDTDKVTIGRGTMASRSMSVGGSALKIAADRVIEKGRKIAAYMMEAAAEDVEFNEGQYAVAGTDKTISIMDVAKASYAPAGFPIKEFGIGLDAEGEWDIGPCNFPNGCQVAEVEIDPDTGTVVLDRLHIVDDVGMVMNPLLLKGQLYGGVAQGVGQVLMEDIVYDQESGQLITGSFMDYCMPRAADFPDIPIETHPVPTPTNPIGVKGAGESGTVGAPPAIMAAIMDALAPLGVEEFDMPASPHRVWRAIQAAKGKAA
jgi:carbon-monoxide dehydrogenase large subunit